MSEYKNIAVVADEHEGAQSAADELVAKYGFDKLPAMGCPTEADLVIVLGGDGFMLHSLHQCMGKAIPMYGMNRGTVGFLMNEYNAETLFERLKNARKTVLHPLRMQVTDIHGAVHEALAINEVSLLRKSGQAAGIEIQVDGKVVLDELVADGVLVSTPAGSSAYNSSVGGPILPLRSELLALTPIAPFRPRRWRGAILPHDREVTFRILDSEKRPANAVADFNEVPDVVEVKIQEVSDVSIHMLFDKGHSLEERILYEQFVTG